MLHLETLDSILSILKNEKNKKLTAHEINVILLQDSIFKLYTSQFLVDKSLEKLIDDNYIKEVKENCKVEGFEDNIITHYETTSHCFNFIGYVNTYYSKLSLEQETKLLRDTSIELNRSTLSANRHMFWLTFIIAIGTAVSAIYYILEIFSVHVCFCKLF
jgi:hypothetical protein